ncbi:MAG: type II secretion system protein GspL [Aquimonas sp.]|nr:type II secretion system protein GspL [Aquimonas sp.]
MPQRILLHALDADRPLWLDLARLPSGPQMGAPPAGAEAVLLLPAEEVLLTRAPRVARSDRLLRQALPFAIEERLAAPVEQLHIAFSGDADPLQVAVIARERLDARLQQARALGLQPVSALSEALLLPPSEAGLLLLDGERVLLRTPAGSVLCEHVDALPGLLELLAEAGAPIEGLQLRVCAGSDAARLPESLRSRAQAAPALAQLLAQGWRSGLGPDLLQGAYAPRLAGDALPWLKRAAVLAGLAVGLAFGHGAVERQQLQSRLEAQRAAMAGLLAEAMPGSPAIDPRAQLEIEYERLRRGGAGDDALALLARIAPSLSGSTRYSLEALDYRSGGLELTLRASDLSTLDGLRETLAALGLQAELTSATPGQGGVEGRIRLRGAGA